MVYIIYYTVIVFPAGLESYSFNHLDRLTVLAHLTPNNNFRWVCVTTSSHYPHRSTQHSLQQCSRHMSKDPAHSIQHSTKDHICGYNLCAIQVWPGVSGCGRDEFSLLVWWGTSEKMTYCLPHGNTSKLDFNLLCK